MVGVPDKETGAPTKPRAKKTMKRSALMYCCRSGKRSGNLRRTIEVARKLSDSFDVTVLLGDAIPARIEFPDNVKTVLLPSLIGAAANNPRLAELQRQFTGRRRSATIEIVERGKQRGELPPDLDSAHLVDLLAGAILYRRLMTHDPIGASYVEYHVDMVLRMCMATGRPLG